LLCVFNDGLPCASSDHFHNKTLKTIILPNGSQGKAHICKSTHKCDRECEHNGVCGYKNEFSTMIYDNGLNKFPYPYTRQILIKGICAKIIPIGELIHKKIHECNKDIHTCNQICPDCGVMCGKPFDHDFHCGADNHRNKERCIYLSTTKIFNATIEGSTRILSAGESAKPSNCSSSCLEKGRGHTHLIPCKSKSGCLELKLKGLLFILLINIIQIYMQTLLNMIKLNVLHTGTI
jgi:hypothetical protein